MLKNKFFLNQLVVFIEDIKNLDGWDEGYIDSITLSADDGVLYGISRDTSFDKENEKGEHVLIEEPFVFRSRYDMFLWRTKHIKDCISFMSKELEKVNEYIKEEEKYAGEGRDKA